MSYVVISKQEMAKFMDALGFHELSPEERSQGRLVKERVYESEPLASGPDGVGRIRVYSTIQGERSRDIGSDAIRVQYWVGNQKVFGAKRVHRTTNWRKNLLSRVEEVRRMATVGPLSRIPKDSNGKLMVVRGKNGFFWGSQDYPRVRDTRQFRASSVSQEKMDKITDRVLMRWYQLKDSDRQQRLVALRTAAELNMIKSEEDVDRILFGSESFKPPASAVANAKKGLELRKEWGRGGLSPSEAKAQGIDSGVTRAKRIASGTVSEHDVRRMSAFNRHRKNYRPDKKESDGGPTAGTIAWLLWGGTTGVNWAKKKSAAMNAETFAAYEVDSWNPYDEATLEEAVFEQFYEYLLPEDEIVEVMWQREGEPEGSVAAWWATIESDFGSDRSEALFEKYYEMLENLAMEYWADPNNFTAETIELVRDECPICGNTLTEVSDVLLVCNSCEVQWDVITDPDQGFEYLEAESQDNDLIKIGDRVASYDYVMAGELESDNDYIVGRVVDIAPVEWCGPKCNHFHIKVEKIISKGQEQEVPEGLDMVFPPTDPFQSFVSRIRPKIRGFSSEEQYCALCGESARFTVYDLPVGPRNFCCERCYAEYAGLPVMESGYYGLDAEDSEDYNVEPVWMAESTEGRGCWVCGKPVSKVHYCGAECQDKARRNFRRKSNGDLVAKMVLTLKELTADGKPVSADVWLARLKEGKFKSGRVPFTKSVEVNHWVRLNLNPSIYHISKKNNRSYYEYTGEPEQNTIEDWLSPESRKKFNSRSAAAESWLWGGDPEGPLAKALRRAKTKPVKSKRLEIDTLPEVDEMDAESYNGPFGLEIRNPDGNLKKWEKIESYNTLQKKLKSLMKEEFVPYEVNVWMEPKGTPVANRTLLAKFKDYGWVSGPWIQWMPRPNRV